MNTCKCGRVVHGRGSLCKSCAKKAGWARGDYDDQRGRPRTLHSGRVARASYPLKNRWPAEPRSAIDNALRDAFRKVIGFDPLHDRSPEWGFPRQIDDETADHAA